MRECDNSCVAYDMYAANRGKQACSVLTGIMKSGRPAPPRSMPTPPKVNL